MGLSASGDGNAAGGGRYASRMNSWDRGGLWIGLWLRTAAHAMQSGEPCPGVGQSNLGKSFSPQRWQFPERSLTKPTQPLQLGQSNPPHS